MSFQIGTKQETPEREPEIAEGWHDHLTDDSEPEDDPVRDATEVMTSLRGRLCCRPLPKRRAARALEATKEG